MTLTVTYTNRFKKDYELVKKRGWNIPKLKQVIELLMNCESLPIQNRDHQLVGTYVGCRECHIEPDWVLIYKIDKIESTLTLLRTGSHSDLFD